MTYIVYLDEFGHVGPYVSRDDPKHNDSPVFGLAGLALPADKVRAFGTWFYQRKCDLLDYEIKRSEKHPATWEKKGAALYTAKNVEKYRELRNFTNRFFNKLKSDDGFVFYVGIEKTKLPDQHKSNQLYESVLAEAIMRLNSFCEEDCTPSDNFLLVLDEHDQRENLITKSSRSMYNTVDPMRNLIEPPFQVESHRYQTMQAADWIAGLVGRFGAIWADPKAYSENSVHLKYFEERLKQIARRSGIRIV